MSKRNSCTSLRPTENCGWTSVAELRVQQGREPQGPSSGGRDPSVGRRPAGPSARIAAPARGAQRRDAGPCRQRRHPHLRRRRRPPSPPPLRVTSPAGGVLQSIALFFLFANFGWERSWSSAARPNVVQGARPRAEPQEVGGERCRRNALATSF